VLGEPADAEGTGVAVVVDGLGCAGDVLPSVAQPAPASASANRHPARAR
jgi:hypothetical protein